MKKSLAVILSLVTLLILIMAPAQAIGSTQVHVSGYFEPEQVDPVFTPVRETSGISVIEFAVTQPYPCFGDMVSSECILNGSGTFRLHTYSPILLSYTASVNMQFEGTIAGRTGEAILTGHWTLLTTDGNLGMLRGKLTVTGIGGELEGMRGALIVNSDTIEDNLVPYEGHVIFAD